MPTFHFIYLGLLSVILSGCGGEGDSSTSSNSVPQPSSVVAINAANVQMRSIVNEPIELNLSTQVHTSDNSGFKIQKVSVTSGDGCQVHENIDNTIIMSGAVTQDCVYQYQVQSLTHSEVKSSAYVRMAVGTTYADNSLPALVRSMDISDSSELTINLRNALSTSLLNDNDVLSSQITVLGVGSAEVTDVDTITYTADIKGSVTLLYSYSDGDDIKQGTLVISVSDTAGNQAPTAQTVIYSTELSAGQEVEIDTKSYGQDADGDTLQLIDVMALNGQVSLKAPDDVSNTRFLFSSEQPGSHDVIYTLSDHRGGIATGIIRIKVTPDFSLIQDWSDISTFDDTPSVASNITFTAPMSKVFADYININYTSVVDDSTLTVSPVKMVAMTYDQAQYYCQSRHGRLPLRREFTSLINNEGFVHQKHNWPVASPFWTAEKNSPTSAYIQDLSLNISSNQNADQVGYVTCVLFDNPKVKDYHFAETELTFVQGLESALNLTLLDPDGQAAPYVEVKVKALQSLGVFSNYESSINKETDSNGQTSLRYFNASLSDDVIQAKANYVNQEYVAASDITQTQIVVTDINQNNWLQKKTSGQASVDLYALTPDGMPLVLSGTSRTSNTIVNTYTQPFKGNNLLAFYLVEHSGRADGYYNFYFHQTDVMDFTKITSEGIYNDPSVYGALISFATARIYDIAAGVKGAYFANSSVKGNYVYTWFDKRGNYIDIYSVSTDVRKLPSKPIEPIRSIEMKNFDASKNTYIVFSGVQNKSIGSSFTVKQLNFTSY